MKGCDTNIINNLTECWSVWPAFMSNNSAGFARVGATPIFAKYHLQGHSSASHLSRPLYGI